MTARRTGATLTLSSARAILGVKRGASLADLKAALREKVQEFHPDVSRLPPEESKENFVLVLRAFETLARPGTHAAPTAEDGEQPPGDDLRGKDRSPSARRRRQSNRDVWMSSSAGPVERVRNCLGESPLTKCSLIPCASLPLPPSALLPLRCMDADGHSMLAILHYMRDAGPKRFGAPLVGVREFGSWPSHPVRLLGCALRRPSPRIPV